MATHYLAEMRQVHPGGPWRLAGYCFGTIVAFELAQRLVAEGEEVRLLAMFNGPSPAWIHQWGWYGNQPSKRQNRPRQPRVTRRQRLLRALREPRRFGTALVWYTQRELDVRRSKYAMAKGRPLPERAREQFFFGLHARAERAYEPTPYPGELLVFSGEGLYEDPELGWGGLAQGGIKTYAVPGEHTNNRDVMREPNVAFVGERLHEYLQRQFPSGQG
jgi:oxalate---CoA ligase